MKNTKKIICLAAALVLAAAMLSACGAASVTAPAPAEDATITKISGECKLEITDASLKVNATSDMMDGTVFTLSVDSYNGEVLAQATVTKSGDNLQAEFAIDDKWKDMSPICANAVAKPGDQTKEITAVYGKKFQNISGDSVIFDMNGNMLVLQSKLTEIK